MKFASSSVVFPANSMITVADDFHSASSLLLPDRVEDDFKDDFAKLLLVVLKEKACLFPYHLLLILFHPSSS